MGRGIVGDGRARRPGVALAVHEGFGIGVLVCWIRPFPRQRKIKSGTGTKEWPSIVSEAERQTVPELVSLVGRGQLASENQFVNPWPL